MYLMLIIFLGNTWYPVFLIPDQILIMFFKQMIYVSVLFLIIGWIDWMLIMLSDKWVVINYSY